MKLLLPIFAAVILSYTQCKPGAEGQNTNPDTNTKIQKEEKVIRVTGFGKAPDDKSEAQKRLLALRAARVDAQRQINNQLKELYPDADSIMLQNFMKRTEEVGDAEYSPDGSVRIKMQIRIDRN